MDGSGYEAIILVLFTMKCLIPSTVLLAGSVLAAPSPNKIFNRQAATCGLPTGYAPAVNAKLPDPFTSANGSKITTKAAWPCRQQEILADFAKWELGDKPPKPATVTGTVTTSKVTVSVTDSGKSTSFSCTVSIPSGAKAPYPAIITIGGASIPIPAGVATINFPNDQVAAQVGSSSRGSGLFYDVYGKSHNAGALTAWAWGVSRVIDVLEADTAKTFDTTKLGVTGCSRNGKGAFIVGALDDRIALTIPQESGSGGAACWRISDSQKASGANIQTAGEIVGENVWFSTLFNSYTSNTGKLPHDHHMLAALVSPRGLFVIENDIDWLGPVSTTGCMRTGREVYKALGVPDAMGFSLVGGHSHCVFPSAQQATLTAFIGKYLLGTTASTANVDVSTSSVTAAQYIDWTTPTLT
ncbi:4-O-methyl-glucuronoyl methylesterase [Lachnellula suecica]|uniref:(4-O-methyl)-D-glucuronate--lignin esterase n=1 Tax=Lachnellula suecica TaxID=602035 RepID=A0A8T9CEI6_9HELO|nr:4-O-methyl-glucuronoyl methylesterase [Lachnellula suecica]